MDYQPFDRVEKLGEPPWRSDDPKVIAWERAHGHDVRLKCYPEFGCQVVQERVDQIESAARKLLEVWDSSWSLKTNTGIGIGIAVEALREALGTEDA